MIRVLTGDNDYARTQALAAILAAVTTPIERFDGAVMTAEQLADASAGMTLFSTERVIVITGLSDNKALWLNASETLQRVGDDTTLLLIEPALDKRTKTYKWLQKNADVSSYEPWQPRDTEKAVAWTVQHAKAEGVTLTTQQARQIVSRVGLDQWQLHHAIEKLYLAWTIDSDTIRQVIDAQPDSNVFELLATALRQEITTVRTMTEQLTRSDDAYRVFGLLTSQLQQLAALVLSGKTSQAVASDLQISPFMMNRLAPLAQMVSAEQVRWLLQQFATADMTMKTAAVPAWTVVESLLLAVATRDTP